MLAGIGVFGSSVLIVLSLLPVPTTVVDLSVLVTRVKFELVNDFKTRNINSKQFRFVNVDHTELRRRERGQSPQYSKVNQDSSVIDFHSEAQVFSLQPLYFPAGTTIEIGVGDKKGFFQMTVKMPSDDQYSASLKRDLNRPFSADGIDLSKEDTGKVDVFKFFFEQDAQIEFQSDELLSFFESTLVRRLMFEESVDGASQKGLRSSILGGTITFHGYQNATTLAYRDGLHVGIRKDQGALRNIALLNSVNGRIPAESAPIRVDFLGRVNDLRSDTRLLATGLSLDLQERNLKPSVLDYLSSKTWVHALVALMLALIGALTTLEVFRSDATETTPEPPAPDSTSVQES